MPLRGRLDGLPPVRIHVGDDEVLLDDSRRYIERMLAAGGDAHLDIWMGMPHGFVASIGRLKASAQALDAIGRFLRLRLQDGVHDTSERAAERVRNSSALASESDSY